ncbi:MAG: serine/threonine phosphatase [Microcoleaceae cyanobacterium]
MLVCPQCQFANPNPNKFCQQCGTSLTHKFCPDCGTSVSLNLLNCPNCGALTGTILQAIVSYGVQEVTATETVAVDGDNLSGATASTSDSVESVSDILEASVPESKPKVETTTELSTSEVVEKKDSEVWMSATIDKSQVPADDSLTTVTDPSEKPSEDQTLSKPIAQNVGEYLDSQQRYQLVEPLPQESDNETVMVSVLDCQPLQVSPIQALQASATTPEEMKMEPFIIPTARAYITLQSQRPQQLPQLQDAWQQPPNTVILLEDFTAFPRLSEQLKQPQTTAEQIILWLQQMAELWGLLTPWQCRQSLLELANLRIRPTTPPKVCLQRLYPEPEDVNLSLTELGQAWKQLFQESQRTLFGSVTQILQQLSEGEIETLEQLQTGLAKALLEVQPDDSTTPASGTTQLQIDTNDQSDQSIAPTVPKRIPLKQLQAVGGSNVGRQRQRNEDAFGIQTLLNYQQTLSGETLDVKGLYVLCDGMGGHAGGDVASQLAVDTLRQYFHSEWVGELPTPEMIREAIEHANHIIYDLNQQGVRSGVGRMGTTLVMAVVADNQVGIAHVGDSRLYRLTRQGGLEQITTDHEVGQRAIQQGIDPETAYSSPDAYQLTQALGPRDQSYLQPGIQFLEVNEDTLFILASDGLTDNNLLETYQSTHLDLLLDSGSNLHQGVQSLIDLANQQNGHDNITVILIKAEVISTD